VSREQQPLPCGRTGTCDPAPCGENCAENDLAKRGRHSNPGTVPREESPPQSLFSKTLGGRGKLLTRKKNIIWTLDNSPTGKTKLADSRGNNRMMQGKKTRGGGLNSYGSQLLGKDSCDERGAGHRGRENGSLDRF